MKIDELAFIESCTISSVYEDPEQQKKADAPAEPAFLFLQKAYQSDPSALTQINQSHYQNRRLQYMKLPASQPQLEQGTICKDPQIRIVPDSADDLECLVYSRSAEKDPGKADQKKGKDCLPHFPAE